MKKVTALAAGMVCATVMTAQASSFSEAFGVPDYDDFTDVGSPIIVTNYAGITGPDGLATFRLTYDITASANIVAKANKWGISGGAEDDYINLGESAVINNIQVIDFNANGGNLTAGDIQNLSFKMVRIQGGGKSADSGTIAANGITNIWTDMNDSSDFDGHDSDAQTIDLQVMTTNSVVDSFYVEGVGDNYRVAEVTVVGAFNIPTEYFVSTTGSDTNPGTLEQPFATIQHAVDVMMPGNTCTIRGGTYRETIDLSGIAGASGNPITLTCYPDEDVILAGTVSITNSWTQHSGNIFKTTLGEDIWQLFVDRKHMTLARFPNALTFSDEMWDFSATRRMKDHGQSTNGHVVDDPAQGATATLAGAGVSFDGCVGVFNFGAFASSAGIVANHAAGGDNFDYSPPVKVYRSSEPYFLEGGVDAAELVMLDSAEEWAYDESTKTLYLWADDGLDPTGRAVEGKNQTYILQGDSSTRHITVDGLNFFGTAFYFGSSDHITIQNCMFDYYSYSKRALGSTAHSDPAFFEGDLGDSCDEIMVYNCEFNYSSGAGLRAEKVDTCNVVNNLFYQNSYASVDGDGAVPSPATVQLRGDHILFRHNTIDTSGSAQGVKLQGDADHPWISEFNYLTACGLQQTDGAAHYSFQSAASESVARYNWFIGNRARDFRWDGANEPLEGVFANIYRCVAMETDRDHHHAYRLKGDFHEIYNNIAIGAHSTLHVSLDKGGNTNTVTRNNAADELMGSNEGDPLAGVNDHNFMGQDVPSVNMSLLLRDPDNWDFRPRTDASELVDQGTNVTCTFNGETVDVTAGYYGTAPDIGAYELGDTDYWIPGRQLPQASMPVPPSGNHNVQLDADLMWLGGLGATSYEVYFGTDPRYLIHQGSQSGNVFDPGPLAQDTLYYWRVDSVGSAGTVTGDVWSASTAIITPIPAAEDTRCWQTGAKNYGTEDPLWIQNNQTRRMYAKFHISGTDPVRSATLRLTVAKGPIPDINVYAVTGEWGEMTLTGANDDLVWGDLLDTQLDCAKGSTVEFDVSSFVTGGGTYTFGITTDADTNGLKISSRESITEAPTLMVASVVGGPPADADVDGLLDAWELDYFGDLTTTAGHGNQDGDGLNDWEESYAGTNPTNPASFFRVTGMDAADPTGRVISWDAVSNRVYDVYGSTNLLDGIFQPLETNLFYPQDSYTDTVFNAESEGYYKLDVRQQ